MAKKIGVIISLSIIAILIITTIIMANIKIDYSIQCNNPDAVYVYKKSKTENINMLDDKKNTVVNYINKASKEISLTALFGGRMNKKAELVQEKGTINYSNHDYLVAYVYFEDQQLMNGNDVYYVNGQVVAYKTLVFALTTNTDGNANYKVYVTDEGRSSYNYYYNLTADFSTLYNFVANEFNN